MMKRLVAPIHAILLVVNLVAQPVGRATRPPTGNTACDSVTSTCVPLGGLALLSRAIELLRDRTNPHDVSLNHQNPIQPVQETLASCARRTISSTIRRGSNSMSQKALSRNVQQDFSEIVDHFIRRYCRFESGFKYLR